jgi:hypothetical protein
MQGLMEIAGWIHNTAVPEWRRRLSSGKIDRQICAGDQTQIVVTAKQYTGISKIL